MSSASRISLYSIRSNIIYNKTAEKGTTTLQQIGGIGICGIQK